MRSMPSFKRPEQEEQVQAAVLYTDIEKRVRLTHTRCTGPLVGAQCIPHPLQPAFLSDHVVPLLTSAFSLGFHAHNFLCGCWETKVLRLCRKYFAELSSQTP